LSKLLLRIEEELQACGIRSELDQESPFPLCEVVMDDCTYVLTRMRNRSGEARLTPREAQVSVLVRRGLSNKAIGHELGISAFTVSAHLRRIFGKLRIDSRVTLAQYSSLPG
jgi:DNA-binding NarL/FixJ family response regulator